MAFELGAIIARIKADTTDFKKGIDQAKSQLGGFNDAMGKSVSSAKTVAAGMVAVGAAVGGIVGFAVKSAASLEQTRTSFETMLGSGEKAGALMKELNAFAASTPFEFPELADAGKKLLAFGFASQDIVPNLRRLGDVASGLGIPIGELSELYGKAKVQGRLFAEDVNQLTGRGIPVTKEFAKQFGVAESEVRGLVESGKIGFPELQKAIESMTNEGGLFAGGMLRQSTTLNGMISTLKDNIGAFAREMVGLTVTGDIVKGGLFDKIKNAAADLLGWLDANKENIKNGFGVVFDFIKANAPIIVGILGVILVAALASAGAAAVAFVASLWPLIAIGAAVGLAFQALQPHFGTIGAYIQGTLVPAFQGFIGWLNQLWQAVLPALLAAWAFLQPAFANLGTIILTQLWPALQNLWTMLQQVWTAIAPTLIPVLQILGAVLGGIIVGAIWLVVTALGFVIGVISDVINWVSSLGQFFAGVINMILMIVGALGIAIGAIFAAAFAIVTGLLVGVGNLFRAIFNTIGAIAAGVLNAIGGYWNMLVGVVRAVLGGIVGVVSNLMQGNVVGAFRAALDAVKGVWNSITGFFSGLISNIISTVGRVKDGIVAPFRQAVDTIKGLMEGAKNALSNLNPFQRHSPSLVDWVKRGTRVIANEYENLNNSIAAGSTAARIQTLGTARSLANISPAQLNVQGRGQGAGGAQIVINVDGVLADSVESKRRFGTELVQIINDGLAAKGKEPIPS